MQKFNLNVAAQALGGAQFMQKCTNVPIIFCIVNLDNVEYELSGTAKIRNVTSLFKRSILKLSTICICLLPVSTQTLSPLIG